MSTIAMVRNADDKLPDDGDAPGTFAWSVEGQYRVLAFVDPTGDVVAIPVSGVDRHWTWNGDEQRPTLTPSIQHLSGNRWHGYITDGTLRTC